MPNALVTGVSSGIGLALTRELLGGGWSLVGVSRRQPPLDGPAFRHLAVDVADYRALVPQLDAACGDFPLDAVIHCAGGLGEIGPLQATDPEAWAETVKQNLLGAYNVVRAAIAHLRPGGGRILLFSGGGAHEPFPNYSAYGVSKAGIVRLVETLAIELKPQGATINCVAPGFIATPIHQATRDAGATRAGPAQWQATEAGAARGDTDQRIAQVLGCVLHLLSTETTGLTGRTVSAHHDPWSAITEDLVPVISGMTTRRLPLAIDYQAGTGRTPWDRATKTA
jgi:NAD(P)-dependent dehydrogenase (short-subunit alcohol dehydrogenase family)